MKKNLGLFLLAATSLFGVSVNDIKISQATNGSPPAYADRFVTPVANSILGFDGSVRPADITLGANLSLVNGVLSATSSGGSVNWGSIGGVLSNQADLVAALAGKQSTLTFSTGLTNTSGTITVNPAQILTAITNLTTNGFVKTSAGNGTLIIDTSTYLTANQTITLSGDASGSGGTAITVTVTKLNGTSLAGLSTGLLKNTTSTGVPSIAAAGTDYVAPGSITSSGLTMSTARLLGRSTASSGAVEEITVGSGLSLSGGTLTATGGGSGTVTTVSVVTANGISGSVANATTTPAITLTLGNITPLTVNGMQIVEKTASFELTGGVSVMRTMAINGSGSISGTNTGDQTDITGNAGTATALQTARAINGVNFDGTTPITVGVAASDITGDTLPNTILTSSLTTVGVIGTGVWQGSLVNGTYGGTGVNNGARLITIGGNLTTVGSFGTTLTMTGTTALTLPTSGTLSAIEKSETFTGIKTFSPTLRTSGTAAYLTVTMPADTGITTTAESIGVNFAPGTRTWATGSVTLQRERVFGANTIAAAAASTFATVINADFADPIQGTNATITNKYSIRGATVLFTGIVYAGSGPTALTNSSGQILAAALALTTGSGSTVVLGTGPSIANLTVTGTAVVWPAGTRQSFNPNTTTPGFNPGSVSGDPATPANGDLWYDSTGNLLRARINGATVSLGSGGGGSGTVNSGTATQFAYYPSSTTAVSSTGTLTVSATGRLTMTPTALSTGTGPYLTINIPTDVTMTAGTESIGISIVTATRNWNNNTAITNQREVVISGPTYTSNLSTLGFVNAATVAITGPPIAGTAVSINNPMSLWVQTGALVLGTPTVTGSPPAATGIMGTYGTTDATDSFFLRQASADTAAPVIRFCKGRGTLASPVVIASGDTMGSIFWGAFDGTNWGEHGGDISMITTEQWTTGARGSRMQFSTISTGTTTRNTALRLEASGQVNAATNIASTTTTTGSLISAGGLGVVGDAFFGGKVVSVSATSGVGYATGAGGAVTQATNKSTGVTLNNVTGAITMNNASLAALTSVSFTLTDSAIAATDTVQVNIKSGGTVGDYMITVNAVAGGSCQITVYNVTAATPLSEALVLNFTVLKGASS